MVRETANKVFFVVVFSQFCGTSLWFATNAVLPLLQAQYKWPSGALGHLTSAIQLGFIVGTLLFAITGITDKFSPSKIFFACSLIAALCNTLSLIDSSSFGLILISRSLTGFFLAGIYPVGMKIAADWNEKGLGHWLGALVGALVLGTAFPHALKLFPQFVEPSSLIVSVSILAAIGGLSIYLFVKDGPYRKPSARFSFSEIKSVFSVPAFRAPAFGYFGHMWEVYGFWPFIPWAILFYSKSNPAFTNQEALLSFIIIAAGAVGCFIGGKLSFRFGSKKIAQLSLISSGICCCISPFIWSFSPFLFLSVMIFWGFMVAADSPQFSALVAANAPPHVRGSAITITTCIGFAVTIIIIQLFTYMQHVIPSEYLFLLLVPGPVIGVLLLNRK